MCTRFLSYVLLLKPDGEVGGPISHDDGDGVDHYISLLLCVCVHMMKRSLENLNSNSLQFTSTIIPDPVSKNYRCSHFNFRLSGVYAVSTLH